MNKLEKLYELASGIKEFDLKSKEAILKELNEVEEDLIKNEILPIVKERIAPALSPVKRELTLVVDYKPGVPVNVLISRKGRVYKEGDLVQISINKPASSQTTAPKAEPKLATQVISPSGTADDEENKPLHRTYGPNQKQYERTAPTTRLRVTRQDGSILQGNNAAHTFVIAIKEAGSARVRELGLKTCKVPLVDYVKDPVYGKDQVEIEDGVFVITHSSTMSKHNHLMSISESLGLGWKVEIITK